MKRKVCFIFWFVFNSISYASEKYVLLATDEIFDGGDTSDQVFLGMLKNLHQICKQHGYRLTKQHDGTVPDVFVAFNAPRVDVTHYIAKKKILYVLEPPSVVPRNFDSAIHDQYDVVMTWHDGLVDGKKYHKFFNYHFPAISRDVLSFHDKKLCVFFGANKKSSHRNELYTKRLKTILFFECCAPQDFDFYGPGWPAQQFHTYRGYVTDKIGVMKQYKFNIAYENIRDVPGYITEKILDTFYSGCVPVYWGAPNVTDYIPKNCFIDRRDFASDAALYVYMKSMDEKTYNQYLDNIQRFLSSPQMHCFSEAYFNETFVKILDEITA